MSLLLAEAREARRTNATHHPSGSDPLAIPCIYDQSIRSEVYGLQLALSMLITYMALRFHQTKDQRIWLIMAFCFGVAGANHSYIAVTLLCLPIASLIAGDCSLRSIGAGIVAGALGLCLYLYLPSGL